MAKGDGGLLDLETHFSFYGAYHSTPGNILLHTLCVWPIVFATLMFVHYLEFHLKHYGIEMYVGFFLTLFYSIFYFLLDKKAGTLASILCFGCWIGANSLSVKLGPILTWKVSLVAQVVCWGAQFIGHGVFEGRAPAILDNLVQACLTAPFFVLLEVLKSVFGYEPYPGFHASVKAKTESHIKKWREERAKKST